MGSESLSRSSKIKLFLLAIIFLLGGFLRFWRLTEIPPGFTPDEAAQGYTAYSILKTGKDEWGVRFPLNPRSFGDFKPPLQTYLMIPSIAVFGLNEFAVRLPNALLGSLAILGVFLLAKELFVSWTIGIFSALFLALSPWHLPLSRGAFEANLTVFFTSFGVFFLLRMMKARRWYWQVLAALFLGLNLFSYHSAKLITPLVVLGFLIYNSEISFKGGLKKIKNYLVCYPLFNVIFLFLLLIAYSSFLLGGQTRGLDIAVFHPTDNWQAVRDERWWAVKSGLPDVVARVFDNKLTYSLSQIGKNYLSYLSPQFLFSEGPGEGTYGMIPGRGVLWWWQLPVLLFGIYRWLQKPSRRINLIISLILLAPIPAALTKGIRAANRVSVMMPWIQILTAASLWELMVSSGKLKVGLKIKSLEKLLKLILAIFGLGVPIFLFCSFLEDYFIQSPRKIARAMLYGRCQAIRFIGQHQDEVERIIISRRLSEPQAYLMFCLRYPPELAQKEVPDWLEYRERGLGFVDQLGEYRLGRYWFKEINWNADAKLDNAFLVGLPEEFPSEITPEKVIFYPSGEPAIIVYWTRSQPVYASTN